MEKISALMDGELDGHDLHQAMLRLKDTEEAHESWATYHLIGDVMRRDAVMVLNVSQRINAVIANEPAILAPRRLPKNGRMLTYALSVAASISAVAVVGWMAFSTNNIMHAPVEVASTVPVVQAEVESQLVSLPSDGQMNEYLLAHQGVSPSTSLEGVAPYIRTISIAPATGR